MEGNVQRKYTILLLQACKCADDLASLISIFHWQIYTVGKNVAKVVGATSSDGFRCELVLVSYYSLRLYMIPAA